MRLLCSQKQHSYLSFKLILFSHANPEVSAKWGFISAFPFSSLLLPELGSNQVAIVSDKYMKLL